MTAFVASALARFESGRITERQLLALLKWAIDFD